MCWRSETNHGLTLGSGRVLTAAGAVRLIPRGAWQRMRTGHGTKGSRRSIDWAMVEVTSDDAPGDRPAQRDARAQRATRPPPSLLRHLLVLPVLDTGRSR